MAGRAPVLAFAFLAVIAGLTAPPAPFVPAGAPLVDSRPQPVPCPPCFVCVQTGIDAGRVPPPECPLPRS